MRRVWTSRCTGAIAPSAELYRPNYNEIWNTKTERVSFTDYSVRRNLMMPRSLGTRCRFRLSQSQNKRSRSEGPNRHKRSINLDYLGSACRLDVRSHWDKPTGDPKVAKVTRKIDDPSSKDNLLKSKLESLDRPQCSPMPPNWQARTLRLARSHLS